MEINKLKETLRNYKKSDVILTNHAELQAFTRDVDIDEMKENIVNPMRLVFAKEQEAKDKDNRKYDCYFAYSKHLYHRYILTINAKIIIVTIIKINRDWQKAIG